MVTAHVDDAGLESIGTEKFVVRVLPMAVAVLARGIVELRVELSDAKCVALASTAAIAAKVARACKDFVLLEKSSVALCMPAGAFFFFKK